MNNVAQAISEQCIYWEMNQTSMSIENHQYTI